MELVHAKNGGLVECSDKLGAVLKASGSYKDKTAKAQRRKKAQDEESVSREE